MAERDWTKEMRKIDRQLESISDEALFPTKTGPPTGPKGAAAKEENPATSQYRRYGGMMY